MLQFSRLMNAVSSAGIITPSLSDTSLLVHHHHHLASQERKPQVGTMAIVVLIRPHSELHVQLQFRMQFHEIQTMSPHQQLGELSHAKHHLTISSDGDAQAASIPTPQHLIGERSTKDTSNGRLIIKTFHHSIHNCPRAWRCQAQSYKTGQLSRNPSKWA